MKWVQDSTSLFITEGKKVKGFKPFDALHGYFYARWPYLYIGVGTGEHWLSRIIFPVVKFFQPVNKFLNRLFPPKDTLTFADTYHGKVVPLSAARQLLMVKEDIHLENLEHVIPYQAARDLVMLQPDHLGVLECPCRGARENPCKPLDVCIIVGEPFVGMMIDHHPQRGRHISQEEALRILQEEDDRGHVHHAFFKDALLGRFYAICNCCSCCCGAIQSQRNGIPMLASSGYQAVIDTDLCLQCETCVPYCQFHAIKSTSDAMVIDPVLCMGCGVCSSKCPQDAIHLQRMPEKGIPLELDQLLSSVISN
jgi:Pyruvate/2-oxoacid:ferredoxin oxidoreductase delta subunit